MSKHEKKVSLDEFPPEIGKQIKDFHDSITQLKSDLKPLMESYEEIESSCSSPLEQAQLGYNTCYALNSLFWSKSNKCCCIIVSDLSVFFILVYLITIGENPQNHEIKIEIDRLKAAGVRLKEISEKDSEVKVSNSRVDANAAKRFVKSALWERGASSQAHSGQPVAKRSRKF